MASRTVALVGARGHLGQEVAKALLSSTFRASYANVVFLKRRHNANDSGKESIEGVEVRYYDDDTLAQALQGVDVLINTVGPAGHDFKDKLIDAISHSAIQLYIPSEFGVDHTVHDFPHAEWDRKKHHYDKAMDVIPNTKVCRIYIGLFLEDSIGPGLVSTLNTEYTRVLAHLTSWYLSRHLAMSETWLLRSHVHQSNKIPETLHISGDALTIRQLAAAMEHAGSSPIQIKEIDLDDFKQKAVAEGTQDPAKCLRFLMGEGKIDHTMTGLGNDNELVNPSQRNWQLEDCGTVC